MHGGAVSRSGGVSKQLPKILSGQELLPAQGLGAEGAGGGRSFPPWCEVNLIR